MKLITTREYLDFIREAIETNGIKEDDIVNKLALDAEAITLDQYRAAAQILVEAYKKENWND